MTGALLVRRRTRHARRASGSLPEVLFVPNDPGARRAAARRIPAPSWAPGTASCRVLPDAAAAVYEPGTPGFNHWQTRASLVSGARLWSALDGRGLPRWQSGRTVLPAYTDAGEDLNAYYDRASLRFFRRTRAGRTTWVCASADVVRHEEGHALLDAVRPDLFDVPFPEAAAAHEAFGDLVSLLAALAEPETAAAVLDQGLRRDNFASNLAEDLAAAVRREGGGDAVERGALRRANNRWRWADPASLPSDGPASTLTAESHNFSRVLTGAVYDAVRAAFDAGTGTPQDLVECALAVGARLVQALRTVPARPSMFLGIGRRMLQADLGRGGALARAIAAGFARHGLRLGAPAASLPMPLRGAPTRARAARAVREALEARKGAALDWTTVDSQAHAEVTHVTTHVPLDVSGVSPRLRGVRVLLPATLRLRTRGDRVLGMLGEPCLVTAQAAAHARRFVRSLLATGDLRPRRAGRLPTHEVARVDGRPTVVRRRFR